MLFSGILAGHPHAQTSTLKWPQTPDLNTRLRRLVAGYLKGCEKEQMKQAQAEKVCSLVWFSLVNEIKHGLLQVFEVAGRNHHNDLKAPKAACEWREYTSLRPLATRMALFAFPFCQAVLFWCYDSYLGLDIF